MIANEGLISSFSTAYSRRHETLSLLIVYFDRRKDPLGVVFLSHWGAEEEV